MRFSEKKFRVFVSTIATVAWSRSSAGFDESFNRRGLNREGLSAEEALGRGEKVAIHPEDLPGILKRTNEDLNPRQSCEREAGLHRRELSWPLPNGNPLRDSSGKLVKWYRTNTVIRSIPPMGRYHFPQRKVELVNRHRLAHVGKTLNELKGV